MGVGKIEVQLANELGVLVDDLKDVIRSEGFGSETLLELRQEFCVGAVVRIQESGEGGVFGSETVQELLDKHPHAVSVDGLLQRETSAGEELLELVARNAVQQRDLLHDLVDGSLDGGEPLGDLCIGHRAQVEGDDGDSVGEVLQVLARAGQAVVVVKVGKSAEQSNGRALAVGDHEALLTASLHLEHLDDGAFSGDGIDEDLLVDGLCVCGGLLEEALLTDDIDVGLFGARVGVGELALVDKVATKLLFAISGQGAGGAESLHAVAVGGGAAVDVLFIDALLVAGAMHGGDTGTAGVDVDGVIGGLLVQTDLQALVITGICGHLGRVQRKDVADDGVDGFGLEVHVVDAQHVVEPVCFGGHEFLGDEAAALELIHHCSQVSRSSFNTPTHKDHAHRPPSASLCPRTRPRHSRSLPRTGRDASHRGCPDGWAGARADGQGF